MYGPPLHHGSHVGSVERAFGVQSRNFVAATVLNSSRTSRLSRPLLFVCGHFVRESVLCGFGQACLCVRACGARYWWSATTHFSFLFFCHACSCRIMPSVSCRPSSFHVVDFVADALKQQSRRRLVCTSFVHMLTLHIYTCV